MNSLPPHLQHLLSAIAEADAMRSLRLPVAEAVDFTSNDYLGVARQSFPALGASGSGGSRLLSGHSEELADLEAFCAAYFQGESALVYSSGYMANIGVLGCIADRHCTIVYDKLIHASMREGMRLSTAQSISFRHQDFADLDRILAGCSGTCFVLAESLYSMDGDLTDLPALLAVAKKHSAWVILDEAHSTGLYGPQGAGCAVDADLQAQIFLRIHTFGKAVGRHGAVVIGPEAVRTFLINRSRSLIYSTALPPVQALDLRRALQRVAGLDADRQKLLALRAELESGLGRIPGLQFGRGHSPICPIVIPGNAKVKAAAAYLQAAGFDVRPILAPTVAAGTERLRVILHSYNSFAEIAAFVEGLTNFSRRKHSLSESGYSAVLNG